MSGLIDYSTAHELIEKRIRALERARSDGELSDEDRDELQRAYKLRERVQRAAINAIEAQLDEAGQ